MVVPLRQPIRVELQYSNVLPLLVVLLKILHLVNQSFQDHVVVSLGSFPVPA